MKNNVVIDKDDAASAGNDDTAASLAAASTATSSAALASWTQVFSFGPGPTPKLLLVSGAVCAAVAGAVGPFMIWYFVEAFRDMVADPRSDEYMEKVKELTYAFLVLGVVGFCSLSAYSTLLQTAAGIMTIDLKTQWYRALLRQDLAYFDIADVSGTASVISSNAAKYERGVGNKLGLFIQFTVTFLGSVFYAFWSSWRTSLVVLVTVPFMAMSGSFLVKLTTTQSQRANAAYATAGSIVYTTVTQMRTILSLNGAPTMIQRFEAGTTKAYNEAVEQVKWLGVANGSLMSSFFLSSVAVPLYGGYLLYDHVRESGCDPSGAVPGVETCDPAGVDILGANFGIFFAASVLPQISTTFEAFTAKRAACFLALQVMNRKLDDDNNDAESRATTGADKPTPAAETEEAAHIRRQAGNVLSTNMSAMPKYTIDSLSPAGKQLEQVKGEIEFQNVSFAYPTRMETNVFESFSLKMEAGKTIALVGGSGSGKSTIAQLVERFYDPTGGAITLDGHDLRDLNVAWLRQNIGLVSQEPALFAASIRDNIAYGAGGADVTTEQIEQAARVANAHDFITSFPDGYNTQVGDRGAKLSGGQKQRIALARTIIKNPRILVLDEATSALDSESERTVQTAIDKLLEFSNRTTIVIAHRLSTIRNADVIVVLEQGKLVEMGSHDELIEQKGAYDALVQAQRAAASSSSEDDKKDTTVHSKVSSTSSFDPDMKKQSSGANDSVPVLQFHEVDFSYPSRLDSPVLKSLNMSVRSGETLAIVGSSGSGKSTIVQLIERFYDPVEGSITFDGVDLRTCSPHWLRDQIGLVSQEPTLFDLTIAENIRFGMNGVSDEQVIQAAKDANAHDFITSFPDGYYTQVGEGGTQVSGGQKQRICIARVLLRRPRLMLLDEATSALDSKSEKTVQEALDKIMDMDHQTTIVIAHRLSTIRHADRIAVMVNGRIAEVGSYDELMSKEKGHFRRLQAFQDLDSAPAPLQEPASAPATASMKKKVEEMKEAKRKEKEQKEKEQKELDAIDKAKATRNANRARQLAKGDEKLFLIGSVGATLTGAIFPAWGILFAFMVELLYMPVLPCDEEADPAGCQETWDEKADEMKQLAADIAWGSVGTIGACMIGYVVLFYGFGTANERMNKRVRDAAYKSLIRQEIAFFDTRPAGKFTSELQDDAALIHSFSGEPIRTLVINVASVVVGLVIGFVYMWPFALLFLGILPFMGFGAEMEMKMYITGEDEGDDDMLDDEHSPGGIVIESLLNIRTIASLTLENTKLREYHHALRVENPNPMFNNFLKGAGFGLGQFFQFWGMGLMFFFGAWILHNHYDKFGFRDFLICMFGLFFSLYGLTVALEGATDRKRAKLAADRIFNLIDRQSAIDPLSVEDEEAKGGKSTKTNQKDSGNVDSSGENAV